MMKNRTIPLYCWGGAPVPAPAMDTRATPRGCPNLSLEDKSRIFRMRRSENISKGNYFTSYGLLIWERIRIQLTIRSPDYSNCEFAERDGCS